jgi:histone H3/H4
MPCFDAHIPVVRHREASAEPKRSPNRAQFLAEREQQAEAAAQRIAQAQSSASAKVRERDHENERLTGVATNNRSPGDNTRAPSVQRPAATDTGWKTAANKELPMSEEVPKEVLVVISKVKAYIRAKSGMNTSDAVTEALSELVRTTCDQAIERAKNEGRKTVMARDIGLGGSSVTE